MLKSISSLFFHTTPLDGNAASKIYGELSVAYKAHQIAFTKASWWVGYSLVATVGSFCACIYAKQKQKSGQDKERTLGKLAVLMFCVSAFALVAMALITIHHSIRRVSLGVQMRRIELQFPGVKASVNS